LNQGPDAGTDDGAWFWNELLESDGLIVSAPIYSRTIPGKLRLLGDKISGPQADVAFTRELLRMRAAGEPVPVQFTIDERVLKPRVGAFIASGGSIPTRWKTLALPLMHTLTASMQVAVVDQMQVAGAGSPASVVLQPDALARAARLGEAVASQLGVAYDDAEYRGDPGVCPLCNLDVVALLPEGRVECASCGAVGRLVVTDGRAHVEFDEAGRQQSILAYAEKLEHFHEVQQTAAEHAPLRAQITAAQDEWKAWERPLTPAAG
jgi:multimeric flavodoxin WrbA